MSIQDELTILLLDNDQLLREVWQLQADSYQINLIAYASSDELFSDIDNLKPTYPIYIDVHLDNEKGGSVAERLFELGFQNLYLITESYNKDEFNIPQVKQVIDKSFPVKSAS